MDIFLILLGFAFILIGIVGSFIPVLPGPPLSWIGLLVIHFTDAIPANYPLLIITGIVATVVFILDYIIPSIGTKKFGGTKAGMIGTTIGLIAGLIFPIPGGIIVGPFIGAFIGEISQDNDVNRSLKAAFGSFLGFVTSIFLKFIVTVIYLGLFIKILYDYKTELFNI